MPAPVIPRTAFDPIAPNAITNDPGDAPPARHIGHDCPKRQCPHRRAGTPLVAAALLLACAAPPPTPAAPSLPEAPLPPPRWPAAGAALVLLPPPTDPAGRPRRVVIDAGHGAPGNLGNTSVRCEREADFTLRTQGALLDRLSTSPELVLRPGRPDTAPLSYDARIQAFDDWPADAVLSLHSDARELEAWTVDPVTHCSTHAGAPGFGVLYSDEGGPTRVAPRQQLARAVSRRLIEAGFPPYAGFDAGGLYEADPEQPGAWIDRHSPHQRIKMLRRPQVPLVIIETHHAIDPEEVARWEEPATLDAFAAALRAALADLGPLTY